MTDLRTEVEDRLTALEVVVARGGLLSKVRGAFDELLHPRGRDGKFIEKNGWVNGTFQLADDSSRPVSLEGNNRVKVTGFSKNSANPDDPYVNVVTANGTPARGLASQVQMAAPLKGRLHEGEGVGLPEPSEVGAREVPPTGFDDLRPEERLTREQLLQPPAAKSTEPPATDLVDKRGVVTEPDERRVSELRQRVHGSDVTGYESQQGGPLNDPGRLESDTFMERTAEPSQDVEGVARGINSVWDRVADYLKKPEQDSNGAVAQREERLAKGRERREARAAETPAERRSRIAEREGFDEPVEERVARRQEEEARRTPEQKARDARGPGRPSRDRVAARQEAQRQEAEAAQPSDIELLAPVEFVDDDSTDFNPPGSVITPGEIAKIQKGPGEPIETDSVEEALELLSTGQKVKLNSYDEVVVLMDEMLAIYKDAEAKGEKAPIYNLCNVYITNTSLFCASHKDKPRTEMPQLKGIPIPGSPASKLEPNEKGEVDLGPLFRKHLEDMGVSILDEDRQASHLKATQSELNGSKVAGMGKAMEGGKMTPQDERLFTSTDNYIVDGHHRWGAALGVDLKDGQGGDIYMPVAVIDMDILDIIAEANDFSVEMGIPQAGVGVPSGGTGVAAPPIEEAASSQTKLLERAREEVPA